MKYTYALAATLPTVLAELHDVVAGDDGQLKFEPQVVTAAVGDQVRFTFYPQHDVAQGPFSGPCTPGENAFYSGRLTFPDMAGEATQQFTINVTDTNPIWYYCTTGRHCQSGMVGGINIPSDGDNTIEAYAAAAANAALNVKPSGEQMAGGVLSNNEESTSSSTTSSGAPSETSPAPSATSSPGAAANVQVGSSSVLALIAGVAAWLL